MIQIVDIECAQCGRRIRTVTSVVEQAGRIDCCICGLRMIISAPQPVTVLSSEGGKSSAA
ncbi:MAG TPA: hypothetical protein VFK06_14540 [Candidatus Angelobacter sp.]|nr:hypothetical protein [Candidatus Angelobacter sp.]